MTTYHFPVPKEHISYISDRPRSSNLTSVRFVAPDRVVCADFAGRILDHVKLYPNGEYQILGTCVTQNAEGEPVETDLIDVRHTSDTVELVLSHFRKGAQGVYRLQGDAPMFVAEYNRKDLRQNHGVRWLASRAGWVLAAYCHESNPCIELVDTKKDRVVWRVGTPALAQDFAFVGGHLFVPMRTPHITLDGKGPRSTFMQASVQLYWWSTATPSERPEPLGMWTGAGHLDAAIEYDGRVYVTNQYCNRIDVFDVAGRRGKSKPRRVAEIPGGFNFPHGIDIRYGQLAVTNYGNNTLTVEPIAEALARAVRV